MIMPAVAAAKIGGKLKLERIMSVKAPARTGRIIGVSGGRTARPAVRIMAKTQIAPLAMTTAMAAP